MQPLDQLGVLGALGEYGLPGAILALVSWIAIQLWRDLKGSWEARLVETQQIVRIIEQTNASYAALAAATAERARASEAVAAAQLATAGALERQVEALRRDRGRPEGARRLGRRRPPARRRPPQPLRECPAC